MEINHPALSPAAVNTERDPCKVTETNAWRNTRVELQAHPQELLCFGVLSESELKARVH